MLTPLNYQVSKDLLDIAVNNLPSVDSRLSLNKPKGRFFYDPWEIKKEFENTVWQKILETLPHPIGEARLIKLATQSCYTGHADIDDRWHLSLINQQSYLIDLDKKIMHAIENPGQWYSMDASKRHTAANFGNCDRIQLVVRQLLPMHTLLDPVRFTIENNIEIEDSRYIFDDVISPQLNILVKKKYISNVSTTDGAITFDIERTQHSALLELVSTTPLIVK